MPYAHFDPDQTLFDQFIQARIQTVVMLIEEGEDLYHANRDLKTLYTRSGLNVIHFPILDFDTPADLVQLEQCLNQVHQLAEDGEQIVVHCLAGRGRTGLFLALLTRRIKAVDGRTAISFLRRYFPAVETAAQEFLVINYQNPE